MDQGARANVYNIPAGLPFARSLAQYLLRLSDDGDFALTDYRVLLPTRRACRILRNTFLDLNDGKPMLLPHMSPIGEVEEEDLSLLAFGRSGGFLDVPEAISATRRRFLLARLVRNVPNFAQTADQALSLADSLAGFIDQILVEGLSLSDLHKIVPEEFAAHWHITIDFLKIISEEWPKILQAEGLVEAVDRRNILLHELSGYWHDNPPEYPVIAAGSTGSVPAVSALLKTVSLLPQGQVILPGLDDFTGRQFEGELDEGHPQYMLRRLLQYLEVDCDEVKPVIDENAAQKRRFLASTLMLPARGSYLWKDFAQNNDVGVFCEELEYYCCKSEAEEAAVISLIMREALNDSKRVTALVTPDRNLARRVRAQCRKWGIDVDDSAGVNLADTRLGKFLVMISQLCLSGYDSVALLSLLKTSLCCFGQDANHFAHMVDDLENSYLRGDVLITDYEMLRRVVAEDDRDDLLAFLDAFYQCVEPFIRYAQGKKDVGFSSLAHVHIEVAENLAQTVGQSGAEVLWRGDTGEAAAQFLNGILSDGSVFGSLNPRDYHAVFSLLLRGVTVRSVYNAHPRLLILGQMEARLTHADTVILGGLVEGVWSPDVGYHPWMSRPMRKAYGLPAAEQLIGIAAHDFVQCFCADKVIMTRAQKMGGSPVVPVRWLDRFDALLRGAGMTLDDLSRKPYREWAQKTGYCEDVSPCAPPRPCPPVSVRPNGVSITKFESWLQNPYGIYMHYILKLRKMRPLLQDNDAALRGNIVHKVIERFCEMHPLGLPEDVVEELVSIARDVLQEDVVEEERLYYWWPKFLRIAQWFAVHEQKWRADGKFAASEVQGRAALDVDGEAFNIYGVADRIDRVHGGYAVIDYKTGAGQLSASKMKKGVLPQLPLEAFILREGGFKGDDFSLPRGDTKYMGYWILTGGREAGKVEEISGDLDVVIDTVLEGISGLVRVFRDAETPYFCVPDRRNMPRFNDYEHVSRLKEWSVLEPAEGDA